MQQGGFRMIDEPRARVAHRHRHTFSNAFAQYRRYGFSESLLATINGSRGGSPPFRRQLRQMLSQLRAIGSYVAAAGFRGIASVFRGFDRRYVLWPVFLLVIECGNLLGKVEGLIRTRGCRRNPFPNPRLGRAR